MPPAKADADQDDWVKFLTLKLDFIKTEMISRANAAYRDACGLDVRQLRVLRNICHHPGVTASDVVRQSLIEKTIVSKILSELFQRKLVKRTPHPDDRRHFQLWPTPAGLQLRDQADVLGAKLENAMLAPLSREERQSLNHLVDKLLAMFQDTEQGADGEKP